MSTVFESLRIRSVTWAAERGIFDKSTAAHQCVYTASEFGEFADGLLDSDRAATKDGIGDTMVTIANVMHFMDPYWNLSSLEFVSLKNAGILSGVSALGRLATAVLKNDAAAAASASVFLLHLLDDYAAVQGSSLADCWSEALTVIEGRTGSMVNGAYVKNEQVEQ